MTTLGGLGPRGEYQDSSVASNQLIEATIKIQQDLLNKCVEIIKRIENGHSKNPKADREAIANYQTQLRSLEETLPSLKDIPKQQKEELLEKVNKLEIGGMTRQQVVNLDSQTISSQTDKINEFKNNLLEKEQELIDQCVLIIKNIRDGKSEHLKTDRATIEALQKALDSLEVRIGSSDFTSRVKDQIQKDFDKMSSQGITREEIRSLNADEIKLSTSQDRLEELVEKIAIVERSLKKGEADTKTMIEIKTIYDSVHEGLGFFQKRALSKDKVEVGTETATWSTVKTWIDEHEL